MNAAQQAAIPAPSTINETVPESITIDPTTFDIFGLPGVSTKEDLADFFSVTTRFIDGEVAAGRFPFPLYIGRRSPRWRRSDVLAWLDSLRPTVEDDE